jgi:excisionase family DNA binding protein
VRLAVTETAISPQSSEFMAAHHQTESYGGPRTLEPVLTINETADLLRVSRGKVYELIRAQELETVRVGERLRIEPGAIRDLLERHREGPPPRPRPRR